MEDMPAGFSDRGRERWHPPFTPVSKSCRTLFDLLSGRPPKEELTASGAVTYQGDGIGQLAGVSLAVYQGDGAQRHLKGMRTAMEQCVTAADQSPDRGNQLSATALDLGKGTLADGAARRLSGKVAGYPYEMQLVVARQGHTLVGLVNAGMRAPDVRRTTELAKLLTAKVGTLDL
ncbi:hypothetical protein [Acrocarpospora catenulata]|uniref:hypothetical protein n=1 Tax=Acrocarpospora catenulata TaxID=2836182 RepID=UPI001BD93E17|nr:hypothetical protein [Acrocarpospora catenulata]